MLATISAYSKYNTTEIFILWYSLYIYNGFWNNLTAYVIRTIWKIFENFYTFLKKWSQLIKKKTFGFPFHYYNSSILNLNYFFYFLREFMI